MLFLLMKILKEKCLKRSMRKQERKNYYKKFLKIQKKYNIVIKDLKMAAILMEEVYRQNRIPKDLSRFHLILIEL